AIGFVRAGVTPFVLFPKLDANTVYASVSFPDGTPERVTRAATERLEEAFWKVEERLAPPGQQLGVTSFRVVGTKFGGGSAADAKLGSHLGTVEVSLLNTEQREVSSAQIVAAWRKEVGEIAGAESLTISFRNFGPTNEPISFELRAPTDQNAVLDAAVERAKAKLAEYPGVYDISDNSIPGKWEYRFRVKPEAAAMGVRTGDLAETVRAAYFGEEVMRVQRGRHEVKIMVRYPRDDRRRLATFDELRVRLDDGVERPITELAEIDVARGYSSLYRVDQKRAITVTADLDEEVANANDIVANLKAYFVPELEAEYDGVTVAWEGQEEQRRESIESLWRGLGVALLAMFVLLSFDLKSYWQPALILLVIPFGAIGAIAGHAILGMPLTLFSMYGLIGLTGIVVNDSIVLVDFINARLRAGVPIGQALVESGTRRFRPVLLTTITTIGGLLPILLETSRQAQVLIPMATSIAFGEIFATVVVLILTPVGYSIGHQLAPSYDPLDGFGTGADTGAVTLEAGPASVTTLGDAGRLASAPAAIASTD
ncbi:MAG: efflux RND transporter permease subunit, partial [Planctomycetota bacterium]